MIGRHRSEDGRAWAIASTETNAEGRPLYRYALGRDWSGGLVCSWPRAADTLVIVGLNPSVALVDDDQTIRKEIGFGRRLGYARLVKFNLYGMVSTDPGGLVRCADPVGPENDTVIRDVMLELRAQTDTCSSLTTLVAWGASPLVNATRILTVLSHLPKPPLCLGTNRDGSPRHTSRIPYSTPILEWARGRP